MAKIRDILLGLIGKKLQAEEDLQNGGVCIMPAIAHINHWYDVIIEVEEDYFIVERVPISTSNIQSKKNHPNSWSQNTYAISAVKKIEGEMN